jgi:hypothetical protein
VPSTATFVFGPPEAGDAVRAGRVLGLAVGDSGLVDRGGSVVGALGLVPGEVTLSVALPAMASPEPTQTLQSTSALPQPDLSVLGFTVPL